MKIIKLLIRRTWISFFLIFVSAAVLQGQIPTYLCELRNDTQVDAKTFEFDVYLLQTGSTTFEYTSMQFGININPVVVNGGTITVSLVSGTSGLNPSQIPPANKFSFNSSSNCIIMTGTAGPGAGSGTIISSAGSGTRIGRIRIVNSVNFGSATPDLTWSFLLSSGYITKVNAYVGGLATDITVQGSHTTSHLVNSVLNSLPTVNATATPTTVCPGSNVQLNAGASGGSGSYTYTWTSNPLGFTSSIATPVVSPSITTIYNVDVFDGVNTVSDQVNVTVNTLPTASAGPALAAICQSGTSDPLGGSVGGSATGGTWTTTAGGTFNSGPTNLNTTWTPPAGYSGTATLILTTSGGLCGNVTANKTQLVNPSPVVLQIGGGAAGVCVGSVTPPFTDATNGGTWSITNGTGSATINSSGVVTGLTAGTVTVTYTVSNSCGTANDTQPLTVNALPTASAGAAMPAMCQATTSLGLGGSVGGSATGGIWSTTAGGTFNSGATNLNTTWTPPAGYSGTATLTLTTSGGSCGTATSSKTQLVNPLPAVSPITGGAATVCVGSNTLPFNDITAGGTWSVASGTGSASITSGGVVTGITPGTVTVTYTVTNSCGSIFATQSMLVNALPSAAPVGGGAANVCVGSLTPAFTDATSGGSWSIVAGTGTASITSGGVVTGLSAGIVTVRYTITNSCGSDFSDQLLTVNAIPTVSAGSVLAAICQNGTTPGLGGSFGGSATGATWSTTAGGIFSPNATTMNATWTPPAAFSGTATLVLTSSGGSCGVVTSSKSQVVNPIPSVLPIGGGAVSVCVGSATPAFTDASAGGIWSITSGTGSASITAGGVVTGLSAGSVIVTYTVTNTCGSAPITEPLTVNPIPSAPVTAVVQPTCSTATGTITVTVQVAGESYSFDNGSTFQGSPVKTGMLPGTYNIIIKNSTGCNSPATPTTINAQPPTPVIPNQTSSILSGQTFVTNPTGGTIPTGTTYTWTAPAITGGVTGGVAQTIPQASINGTLTIPTGSGTAVYTVTPVSGSCTGATFLVTVTVTSPCIPVSIGTQPTNASMCATSGTGSFTVAATGTAPFIYQWQYFNGSTWNSAVNGTPAGAVYTNSTTATLNIAGITGAGIYQYRCFISNCSAGSNATSGTVTLTVNALPIPTLISSDPDNTICQGASVTFTAGGGTNYDFRIAGVTVQTGTSTFLTTTSLTDLQQVTVNVTNASGCSVLSSPITNHVNALPTLTISSPATCSADFLTYSVGVTASAGATVTSTSGIVTNTSGNIWSISGVLANTNISVKATVAGSCETPLSVTAPNCSCPVVLAPVSGGNKSYCSGGVIPALTATVLGGETIDWFNSSSGGTLLGSGLSYTPTVAGTYYAMAKNTTSGCVSSTRTAILLTMNASPVPTLISSDADNTFCAGTSVTFTAGGGTSFIFRVAGVDVQNSTSPTYTTSTLTTGQTVDVIVTNANGCSATSAAITNTVSPLPVPILTSSDADNSICSGTSVTFTTSGGASYNFRVNGTSVQNGISPTYTTSTLTNGQTVDVVASNAIGCTVTSAAITNTVSPQPTANGGTGGNVCGFSFKLNGVPSIGLGTWTTAGPGTATFAPNANTANATVTVSDYGSYTFTWTEVSGQCSGSSTVAVNFYLQPVANAGTGGNNCGLNFHLNGTLNIGSGTWAKVSGPGNVTFSPNANDPHALVTVSAYGNYTFSWTVVNGSCTNSDNVNVVFIQQVPANGGSGGSECDKDFILNATVPTNGTGTWSKFSGSGNADFTPDSHQPNAKVTVDKTGAYEFAWTVVNSSCSSSDIIKVTFHDLPVISAGRDTAMCKGGSVQLKAVGNGSVLWTPAAKLSNPNIINPIATPDTTMTFTVKLTDQFGCKNSDSLLVTVRDKIIADAGPDQTLGYELTASMGAILSHPYESGVWSVISGTGELSDSTLANTSVENLSIGVNQFLWTVKNGYCPLSRDTANIVVNDFVIPTLITPNMDGRNDYFVLGGLSTLGRSELVIFDRRGAQVYKNSDYDNSWNGVDYNKNPLPDDTYFYVLKTANGKSISGYIVIRR